jgi:hypothetical protein
MGDFGEVGFRGLFGKKREIGAFGWPAVGGLVGERPAVMFWWWVWWWVVVGGGGCGWFWIWGGEGRRCGDGGGVRLVGKMGEKGKKSDLKAGLDGPKTEYVRTYIGTFDRTRAGACVCEAACVRTYASTFERTRAVQWV